jgi:hypothetical protein
VKKSFNIQELLHLEVQTSWNQAHAPLLMESSPRHQELDLKHPRSVDLITTKQNKLPSFIDTLHGWEKGQGYVSVKWRERG